MSEHFQPPTPPRAPADQPPAVLLHPSARRLEAFAPAADANPDYDAILERVFADVSRREGALESERAQAPSLLAELEAQPAGRQKLLIRNSRRFQIWPLCQQLIAASHRMGFNDPAASRHLAELATEVAERLDREVYGEGPIHDLKAAAWAQLGNALRIGSELRRAEEAFGIAEHLLLHGSGDPLELAHHCDLKASLRRAQRRFDESIQLLDQALAIYREVGDAHREGRSLIQQGAVYALAGDHQAAIEAMREGLAGIDAEEDRRLAFYAQHNLIVLLSDCGRHLEAQALLAQARRVHYQLGDAMNLLRLRWAEGRIAAGLGHTAAAEVALTDAQQGFMEHGLGYNAALVSLDLAMVYSTQGRTADMKRLAIEMLPIFRAQDVHREALAALLLFRQALETETASRQLIEEMRRYLDQARDQPRLRFNRPPRS